MVSKLFYVSVIFLLCIRFNYGITCDTFKNVLMELHQREGNPFNKSISGCIERIAFNDENVITKTYVRNQTIEILGQDAVRNMVRLKVVSFWGCNLSEIQTGAFRNIPRLKGFEIVHGNLKVIRGNVFNATPDLEVVKINGNVVDVIEDEAFANLVGLKRFYANNNKLGYWRKEWFVNSTGVVLLDLQFNQIKKIPGKAFVWFRNLTHIYFDYNEISSIEVDGFKELRDIHYLGLRFNRLVKIGDDVFPNTVKIRSLFLDANYFNYIPNKMMQKIVVKELTIDGNPWKCPCLMKIGEWLHAKHATLKKSDECSGSSIPECAVPKEYPNTCMETVDFDLTRIFINTLKNLSRPLKEFCARTDEYLFLQS